MLLRQWHRNHHHGLLKDVVLQRPRHFGSKAGDRDILTKRHHHQLTHTLFDILVYSEKNNVFEKKMRGKRLFIIVLDDQ